MPRKIIRNELGQFSTAIKVKIENARHMRFMVAERNFQEAELATEAASIRKELLEILKELLEEFTRDMNLSARTAGSFAVETVLNRMMPTIAEDKGALKRAFETMLRSGRVEQRLSNLVFVVDTETIINALSYAQYHIAEVTGRSVYKTKSTKPISINLVNRILRETYYTMLQVLMDMSGWQLKNDIRAVAKRFERLDTQLSGHIELAAEGDATA